MRKRYTVLTMASAFWLAALTIVISPTIGLTSVVYPRTPSQHITLYFFGISSIIFSAYLAYLGATQVLTGER
jgi:hypothetical protein